MWLRLEVHGVQSFNLTHNKSHIYIYIEREREREREEESNENKCKIRKQENNSGSHMMWAPHIKEIMCDSDVVLTSTNH